MCRIIRSSLQVTIFIRLLSKATTTKMCSAVSGVCSTDELEQLNHNREKANWKHTLIDIGSLFLTCTQKALYKKMDWRAREIIIRHVAPPPFSIDSMRTCSGEQTHQWTAFFCGGGSPPSNFPFLRLLLWSALLLSPELLLALLLSHVTSHLFSHKCHLSALLQCYNEMCLRSFGNRNSICGKERRLILYWQVI